MTTEQRYDMWRMDDQPAERGDDVELLRRQSLQAVVIRACAACGAPGSYKSHESIRDGWPGCYVPPGHPMDTLPVGSTCPNCGADRPAHEPKGEIWFREWWQKVGSVFSRGGRL